jgi:hypothetical protein
MAAAALPVRRVSAVLPKMSDAERRARVKKLMLKALGQDDLPPAPWMLRPDGLLKRSLGAVALVGSVYILFAEPYLVAFDVRAVAAEVPAPRASCPPEPPTLQLPPHHSRAPAA